MTLAEIVAIKERGKMMKRSLCMLVAIALLAAMPLSVGAADETAYDVWMEGIYQIRDTITAVHEGLDGTVQWQIADSEEGQYSDIADATGDTYLVPDEYAGKWLRFSVTSGDDVVYAPARKIADALPIPVIEDLTITGVQARTPVENTFKVGDKTFILLETTESDAAKFYILTEDFYGKHAANTSGVSNLYDEEGYGIHEWLNGEFLESGNSSYIIDENENNQLPNEIVAHIDRNRVWLTEPRNGEGTLLSSVGGVSLLSLHEVHQYVDKIGFTTEPLEEALAGGDNRGDTLWPTRTSDCLPAIVGASNVFTMHTNPASMGSIQSFQAAEPNLAVRPAFYLNAEFFSEVRIEEPGEAVCAAIREVYSRSELEGLYTTEELQNIFGYSYELTIDKVTYTDAEGNPADTMQGLTEFTAQVQLGSSGIPQDVLVVAAVYDEQGAMIGIDMLSGTVPETSGELFEVRLSCVKPAHHASVFVLNGLEHLLSVSNIYSGVRLVKQKVEHRGIEPLTSTLPA